MCSVIMGLSITAFSAFANTFNFRSFSKALKVDVAFPSLMCLNKSGLSESYWFTS